MAYVLAHAEVVAAIVEDQEQVDKLLSIAERTPTLKTIVYDETRGMRIYDAKHLHSFEAVQQAGRERLAEEAGAEAAWRAGLAAGRGGDLAILLYTSGTTGRPKGVMLSYDNLVISARNGNTFDRLGEGEETIAYLPMAWVGDHIFSYAQSYTSGYCVNCPESPETVIQDRREIGPTYFFAPPRVFESLLTLIVVRMEDASGPKRAMFRYFMNVAKRSGEKILNGERVSFTDRLLYALGRFLVYGPITSRLGFSRLKVGYTAGEAIGPEIFRFYRSLGINLKQLYGQTEASVYITMQADGDIDAETVGRPAPEVEIRIADNGEVLYRSPGVFQGYYRQEEATRATKDDEGWVKTGDAGLFDKHGNLRILDRAKDVGRLAGGTLFPPKYIENKLKFFPDIKEAVVFGDGRDRVCAFINIDTVVDRLVGGAQQRLLFVLSGACGASRGRAHRRRACRPGEPRPGPGARHVGLPDQPLPHPPQGARSRRRRADANPEGAARAHRGALRRAHRRALFERRRGVCRDRGHLRGRAQGDHLRHGEDPRHGCLCGGRRAAGGGRRVRPLPPAGLSSAAEVAAANEPDILLKVDGISLYFGGLQAIRDVSFDIRRGEIRAIIGPNGAGKTSMLNVINGFYHPQHGTITFKDRTRQRMRPHDAAAQGIARTFQNVALFRGMSTLDNIMSGRSLKMTKNIAWQMLWVGPARREEIAHRREAERIIDFLEIEHIRKTPVGRLPYGLQKRVELGRALAMEPDLLLLDEPMAGMNLEEKEDMSRFIIDVNQEFGTTVALIEHDMGVVMDLSDRVLVLDYGRKIADGTPAEVRANQDVIDAYLGVAH